MKWLPIAGLGVLVAAASMLPGEHRATHAEATPLRDPSITSESQGGGGPGNVIRAVPLFNDSWGLPYGVFRNFGLKEDRGLPILALPGVLPGDEAIIGSPPKAYRFTYRIASVGFVWSNFIPTWMPRIYGDNFWYERDWRARIWPEKN